jgi:hypothetical protein
MQARTLSGKIRLPTIRVARFALRPVVALVEIKKRRWKFANVLCGEIDYLLRPC